MKGKSQGGPARRVPKRRRLRANLLTQRCLADTLSRGATAGVRHEESVGRGYTTTPTS